MTITITFKMFMLVYLALGFTQFNAYKADLKEIAQRNDSKAVQFLSFWFLMLVTVLIQPVSELFMWVRNGFIPEKDETLD